MLFITYMYIAGINQLFDNVMNQSWVESKSIGIMIAEEKLIIATNRFLEKVKNILLSIYFPVCFEPCLTDRFEQDNQNSKVDHILHYVTVNMNV